MPLAEVTLMQVLSEFDLKCYKDPASAVPDVDADSTGFSQHILLHVQRQGMNCCLCFVVSW